MSRRDSRSGIGLPAGQVTALRTRRTCNDGGKLAIPDWIR